MFPSHAVDENRLMRGIFHQREKLLDLFWGGRRAGCHGNVDIRHTHPLNRSSFVTFLIVDEVNDGLDAEGLQIAVILALRLSATIVIFIDLPKVLDVDAGKSSGYIRVFDRTGWSGLGC